MNILQLLTLVRTNLLSRIRTNTRLAATSIIRFYDIDILLTFRTSINSLLF